MTTALWLLAAWAMFCVGFVAGCWWLSVHAAPLIDRAGFALAHPPANPAPPANNDGRVAQPERAGATRPKEA